MIQKIVANAFSLQMLPDGLQIYVNTIPAAQVRQELGDAYDWISIVGHADTAAVFSEQLGLDVVHDRHSIKLQPGDVLYVGQLMGGRLPEGATTLPDGFRLTWKRVSVYAEDGGNAPA